MSVEMHLEGVRLKEDQTKHTSLIPTERLQYKKSLGRIFGAATPPGALAGWIQYIHIHCFFSLSIEDEVCYVERERQSCLGITQRS